MKTRLFIIPAVFLLLLASCKKVTDRAEIKEEAPVQKTTSYTDALSKLGRMTKTFGTGKLYVQSTGVMDDTGTSQATGGEIPFDVTEMIKSAVNRVGGHVVFVPYDPIYLKNQAGLKFTTLEGKAKPDVVINGGITEFDRGIESSSDGFDFGGSFGDVGAEIGVSDRESSASITLDLNLIDFDSMAMVPRMQAVNTIRVFKAASDTELGFSIMGAAFGFKGTVKRIQGRHAAVRVLVEMSILEVLGKYLNLPYWKLIPGSKPDQVVLENIRDNFYAADQAERIRMIQRLLPPYGFRGLRQSGTMDAPTSRALASVNEAYGLPDTVDANYYEKLFLNAPVGHERSKVDMAKAKASASTPLTARPTLAPTYASPAPAQAAPAPAQAALAPAAGPLNVKVWTDNNAYRQGDRITISLQGNRDFYGKVLYQTADGNLIQVLPNGYRKLDRFEAGKVYTIPDAGDGFQLEVGPPFGQEKIILYACEEPLKNVQTQSIGQGLSMFDGSKADLDRKVRGIQVAKGAPPSGPKVIEAQWALTTSP